MAVTSEYARTIDGTNVCPKEEWTLKDLLREIDRLNGSRLVALARKESEMRCRIEDHLYELRRLEARGREIMEKGVDTEFLESLLLTTDWGC